MTAIKMGEGASKEGSEAAGRASKAAKGVVAEVVKRARVLAGIR